MAKKTRGLQSHEDHMFDIAGPETRQGNYLIKTATNHDNLVLMLALRTMVSAHMHQ
jgi:hypothetical protein